jgi:CRP-like cAMP-binding protein
MPKRRAPDAVIEARRRFLSEGAVPDKKIRLPILRSWQRSAERGLDMEASPEICILPDNELREAQQRNETLVRAARGELEALFNDAAMSDAIVILTDAQGIVLLCLGKGKFARDAASVALRAGAKWDEEAAGTNAIGAVLAEQHPISVLGGEHFFSMHKILSCSAVPIFDPFGGIAGVLDLTNASDVPQVHALALVNRAAQAIECRLFQHRFHGHEQMQFHPDPYLIGSSHEGLLAFTGSRLAGANRNGVSLLGLDWKKLDALHFEDLFRVEPGEVSHNPSSDDFTLQTKKGVTLYARMRPHGQVHRGWSPAGALSAGTHGAHAEAAGEASLLEIVDRLLAGPLARQLKVRRIKTGQLIYGTDAEISAAQGFVIVRDGRLRCFASFDGKELTLFTLDPGDVLPISASSIFEAKKDSEIVIMSGKAYRELALSDPDLARSAMPAISRMLQKSEQMIEDMVFRGVKYRVIRALCEAAERDGRESTEGIMLDKPPSAEEFAMQIGATRQSVSTVIAGLIRDGIVRRRDASAIAICDLARLKRELEEGVAAD